MTPRPGDSLSPLWNNRAVCSIIAPYFLYLLDQFLLCAPVETHNERPILISSPLVGKPRENNVDNKRSVLNRSKVTNQTMHRRTKAMCASTATGSMETGFKNTRPRAAAFRHRLGPVRWRHRTCTARTIRHATHAARTITTAQVVWKELLMEHYSVIDRLHRQ